MSNSSTCCSNPATRDALLFGALVALPPLLGLNRGIWALTTALAVGKLSTSLLNQQRADNQPQQSNPQQSRPQNTPRPQPQPQPQSDRAPAPAGPQPHPHHTPAKGGLDHIEGAGSGPLGGAPGVAVIR